MAFFRRKKTEPAPAETQGAPEIPVTLALSLSENADPENVAALLSALPEHAEVAISGGAGELALPEGKNISVIEDAGRYSGKYVVRADGNEKSDKERAEELFGFLSAAEEDLIFFGEKAQECDPLADTIAGKRPLPAHCAAKRELAQGTRELGRTYAESFVPLLFAKSAACVSLSLGEAKNTRTHAEACSVLALAEFFNKVKPALDADRYRFAFNFICKEWIGCLARASLAGKSEEIADADAKLKETNMALWVAVAEKAPLGFAGVLRKKNYTLPLYLKTALKALSVFKKQL